MSNIETPTEDRIMALKYILDPISTIIKLCILSKKPVGCKICVSDNTIFIQDVGIFQALVRYVYKTNKIDIQYLYNPIELACAHFLTEPFLKNNPNIKNLFINAQKGILSLVETYKNFTIITHTLFFYYNIIANYLGEKYNDKLFMRDNISNVYNKELVSKLNAIWTNERIKIVLNMIDFMEHDKTSVKCLEEFMVLTDKEVATIIQEN